MNSLCAAIGFRRLPIQDDVDLVRVRPENADLQIVANAVWSQNPEWIGMCPGEKLFNSSGGNPRFRKVSCEYNLMRTLTR